MYKPFDDSDIVDINFEPSLAEIAILSSKIDPVVPSLRVENPLPSLVDLPDPFTAIRAFGAKIKGDRKLNFFMPHDFMTGPIKADFREIVGGMGRVLDHDYIPAPPTDRRNELALAFVAPMIAVINKEVKRFPTYTALILGAGIGKDIARVRRANPGITKLVCVEPHEARFNRLVKDNPGVLAFNAPVRKCLGRVADEGPFDLIVCNMSLHYIMGVKSGAEFVRMIPRLLTPRGFLFGSFVDIPSVKASGVCQHTKFGHSILYLSETKKDKRWVNDPPINGIAEISMAGINFSDPYLTIEQYYDAFKDIPVNVNIYDGAAIVRGSKHRPPLYNVPPIFSKSVLRAELMMYRCLLLRRDTGTPAQLPGYEPLPALMPANPNGLAERAAAVHYNKGLPLIGAELQFMCADSVWMAEKMDGEAVSIVHSAGSLVVVHLGTTQVSKVPGFTSGYEKDFILQAELLSTGEYIVVDVPLPPWGDSGNFLSRWRWLESIYSLCKWPFQLQSWYRLDDYRLDHLLNVFKEGAVLQSLIANPGLFALGAGSARYVKRVYTIETRKNGVIWEVDLNGKDIRLRPDRKEGNAHDVVKRIRQAVEYDLFAEYLYHCYVQGQPNRLIYLIRDRVSLDKWTETDFVDFACNESRLSYDESVDSSYLQTLRLMVAAHMMRNLQLATPPPDSVQDVAPDFGE